MEDHGVFSKVTGPGVLASGPWGQRPGGNHKKDCMIPAWSECKLFSALDSKSVRKRSLGSFTDLHPSLHATRFLEQSGSGVAIFLLLAASHL